MKTLIELVVIVGILAAMSLSFPSYFITRAEALTVVQSIQGGN